MALLERFFIILNRLRSHRLKNVSSGSESCSRTPIYSAPTGAHSSSPYDLDSLTTSIGQY